MTDSSTQNPVLYHDVYTAVKDHGVVSAEQMVFLLAALFILGIFLLICFAGTILITRWIVSGNNCSKSKCTGDEEEHYRMRQEVSEWKLAQERMRGDLERKMDRERDTGAHKSPSTVIKIDQAPPQTIIDRGRDCHGSAPDMSQIMSLLGQRPLIQTVFSQPSVPMAMPMQPGYNHYQPQAMPPPQGYPFPQLPSDAPPPSQVAKRKKTSSASPSDVLSVSMSRTRATSTPTPTSASSPRKSKKRHRHSRSRTRTPSRSRSHSKSPANYPISKTANKDDTPSTFSTVTTTSKTSDLPELTDSSGDHRTDSTVSVSSHTSDLTEFSDVPAVKPRPNQRSIGQRHRHRRRSKSRTPSKSPTPSSKTNNDLMEFSDSSRKSSSKRSDSTVSSVPSTSTVSTTLTPEKQKSSSPMKSKSSSASRSSSSPMKLVRSNKGSADSTLSVEMSPSAEKEEKKVVKVVELQFKPATAAATTAMLAKYQKTKNRHQMNPQFELVPEESDSPVSTTDLGTSISSSVSSVTSSTITPAPKESVPKESPPKPSPPTTTTRTSPTTSTWTPRPPDVVSTPPTSAKTTDKTSPVTTTGVSTSPIEKAGTLPASPASSLRSDTSKVSSPEMKLEVTQNDESEKHLRRNVPVRPSFAGALADNLAKHGKADHKKAATWRYQFVPDDTKLPKVFRQAPTLPAPELPVDVTQEDESIRREATLHRLHAHPRTIGGVIHTQAARGKFDSTAFAVNEQFVVVPDDEGFRSESQSTQSSAPSTTSSSQPVPPPTSTKPKSTSTRTPNIADKIYQSRNPYWRARIDETAPTHDIANIRHILSPQVETAISKPPSATSPDPSMLTRTRSSRRRDSLTVSAESVVMPAPLNRGLFVRPGPTG
uniref:Flocculation protein FLO11-like n=1 Tax=Panagrellus redivivus TaxID=6233 RepID=A0A7E4WCT2_PANRE